MGMVVSADSSFKYSDDIVLLSYDLSLLLPIFLDSLHQRNYFWIYFPPSRFKMVFCDWFILIRTLFLTTDVPLSGCASVFRAECYRKDEVDGRLLGTNDLKAFIQKSLGEDARSSSQGQKVASSKNKCSMVRLHINDTIRRWFRSPTSAPHHRFVQART